MANLIERTCSIVNPTPGSRKEEASWRVSKRWLNRVRHTRWRKEADATDIEWRCD